MPVLFEPVDFIESRSWYQTIEFENDLVSKGFDWCGDPAWKHIRAILPESLEGLRILDLGCNAGIFCVRAALEGAREVVGVDWPGWRPGWDFKEQRIFVKEYFTRKHKRSLPITYVEEKMEDYLRRPGLGRFDYVLGIASLYYTEDPCDVVRRIADIADNVIVRLRDESIIKRFRELFLHCGYEETKEIRENWSARLGRPADDFWLYRYFKHRDLEIIYYRILNGHEELTGSEDLLDIWQLMDLVGTELPIAEYVPQVQGKFITYLPLKDFANLKKKNEPLVRFVPGPAEKEAYPWDEIAASIKQRGFIVPIIAEEIIEEGEKRYVPLEGRHRLAAATMIEPFDPEYRVPCLIVKEAGRRV